MHVIEYTFSFRVVSNLQTQQKIFFLFWCSKKMPSVFENDQSCVVFPRSRGFLPNRKFLSPCLGFFLQGSVKAISICDVIMNMYMMAIHTYGIIFVVPQFDHVNFTDIRPSLWTFRYVYFSTNIALSILLYKAASKVSSIWNSTVL